MLPGGGVMAWPDAREEMLGFTAAPQQGTLAAGAWGAGATSRLDLWLIASNRFWIVDARFWEGKEQAMGLTSEPREGD